MPGPWPILAWPLRSPHLVYNREQEQERPADRIEKAAIELFGQRGIAAVSVRELAREAHVTVGSISYYYGSKEALYRHCVAQLVREFVEDVATETLTGSWFPGQIEDERTVRLRRLVRMWVDLQMTRDESLRGFGNENLMRPVWQVLRAAHTRGGDDREKRIGELLGYVGSMVLGSVLTDDQLERLVDAPAADARGQWQGLMQRFLAGDMGEKAVESALHAAASKEV